MTVDFHRTLEPMVKQVSKFVKRNFPPNILLEDIEQAIWLGAYQEQKSITRKIENEPESWIPQIAATLRKKGTEYALNERAALEGYHQEDYQKYSVQVVRTLLPDVFDHQDWQSFAAGGDGQPRSRNQANTTGDRIASLIDVSVGLKKLKTEQYNTLVWVYKFGYTNEMIAEEYGCNAEAARKRVERAVQALARTLGYREPVEVSGGRTVRSNAAWQAALSNQYEE